MDDRLDRPMESFPRIDAAAGQIRLEAGPGAGRTERFPKLLKPGLDWEALRQLAIRQDIVPLAYQQLRPYRAQAPEELARLEAAVCLERQAQPDPGPNPAPGSGRSGAGRHPGRSCSRDPSWRCRPMGISHCGISSTWISWSSRRTWSGPARFSSGPAGIPLTWSAPKR